MNRGKVVIIGGGNMGGAILDGLMKGDIDAKHLHLVEIRDEVRKDFEQRYGISTESAIDDTVTGSNVIILAVKPQIIRGILSDLKPLIDPKTLILSVAAGIPLSLMECLLPDKQPVARTMPNIAAKVGESAVAICYNRHAGAKHRNMSRMIGSTIGMVVEVDEEKMDAVTGLSGSGPAFIFLMVEALADGGVLRGLPRQTATALAIQTVFGAASMLRETGEHPAVLREQVTSPGGTTAEGLFKLEQGGFKHLVIDAVRAAAEKSELLGKKLNA
jgi:pyrroline-5-carboxylate reductase